MTRDEAIAAGKTRYFTGETCPRGHISERLVSTYGCIECKRLKDAAYYERNPERGRAKRLRQYWSAPEKQRAKSIAWRHKNRDRVAEYDEYYRTAFPYMHTMYQGWFRAEKLSGVAPWADREKITEFYREAHRLTQETGVQHEVDHIIPLVGTVRGGIHVVSGLHTHDNLQIITRSQNRSKRRKVPVDIALAWVETP